MSPDGMQSTGEAAALPSRVTLNSPASGVQVSAAVTLQSPSTFRANSASGNRREAGLRMCPTALDTGAIWTCSGTRATQHEAVLNELMSGSSLSGHLLSGRRSAQVPGGVTHTSCQCWGFKAVSEVQQKVTFLPRGMSAVWRHVWQWFPGLHVGQ